MISALYPLVDYIFRDVGLPQNHPISKICTQVYSLCCLVTPSSSVANPVGFSAWGSLLWVCPQNKQNCLRCGRVGQPYIGVGVLRLSSLPHFRHGEGLIWRTRIEIGIPDDVAWLDTPWSLKKLSAR